MQLRRNAKIELLRRVPLFEGCSQKELGQISTLADEISQPAGATLIKEGAKGREFFVLVDGTVDIRRKGRKLGSLDTGDFFGEIALLTETPRSATVVTATPVRLLVDHRPVVPPAPRRDAVDPGEGADRAGASAWRRRSGDLLRRHAAAGPEWDPSQPLEGQSGWEAHADFMDDLVARRLHRARRPARRRASGRARSRGGIRGGRARDAARDPWSGTHLVVDSVDGWTIRLDGRRSPADA